MIFVSKHIDKDTEYTVRELQMEWGENIISFVIDDLSIIGTPLEMARLRENAPPANPKEETPLDETSRASKRKSIQDLFDTLFEILDETGHDGAALYEELQTLHRDITKYPDIVTEGLNSSLSKWEEDCVTESTCPSCGRDGVLQVTANRGPGFHEIEEIECQSPGCGYRHSG